MGTAEWTNWSRIGTSFVSQAAGGPALIGGSPVALPFQFRDGWFYSIGAEYMVDAKTTLRGGVAYEVSPITDRVRIPLLPDNDRIWLSVGASYKMLPNLIMDVGYSHIWVKDANINVSPGIARGQIDADRPFLGADMAGPRRQPGFQCVHLMCSRQNRR